ncbi:MAG: phosphatase PAP2 family protein [Sandaracinaceae bacterium]
MFRIPHPDALARFGRVAAGLAVALLVAASTPVAAQDHDGVASPTEAAEEAQPEAAPAIPRHHTEREEVDAFRSFPATRWRWESTDVGNFVLMGIAGATAGTNVGLGSAMLVEPNRGRNPFDEGARDGLRLAEEGQRLIARDVSDGFLTLMTSAPILFDALVLGAWLHDDPDIAFEMIIMHAEVVFVTLALQTTANVVVSRERPYGRTCTATPGPDEFPDDSFFCDSPDRFYSFFSGHTSQSFASAAVVCSAHMNMPLLGGGAADIVPCVTGFAFAAATGMLRLLGDMHYATDVITGAAVGTAVGFLLPWALHFSRPRRDDSESDDVSWVLVPSGNGASVFGVF